MFVIVQRSGISWGVLQERENNLRPFFLTTSLRKIRIRAWISVLRFLKPHISQRNRTRRHPIQILVTSGPRIVTLALSPEFAKGRPVRARLRGKWTVNCRPLSSSLVSHLFPFIYLGCPFFRDGAPATAELLSMKLPKLSSILCILSRPIEYYNMNRGKEIRAKYA